MNALSHVYINGNTVNYYVQEITYENVHSRMCSVTRINNPLSGGSVCLFVDLNNDSVEHLLIPLLVTIETMKAL